MYRKINIKILVAVFVALLAIVVLVGLADSRKGGRNFKSDLVEVDVPNISSIEVYPKATNGALIKLYKQNDEWQVESDGKKYRADQSLPGSMISQLNMLKPESVAATDKNRWEQFEATDSLGTRVKLFSGDKLLTDIILGKFSFSQPRKMTTYVRLTSDKEVYGVDGMIGMSFNRDVDAFRDKTIIKSTKTDWVKLTYSYPADSSFTLEKVNDTWMVDGETADSASVEGYFNSIARLTENKFAETKPVSPATHRLRIEGNNMMSPVEITGYSIDGESFVFGSSQNPNSFFNNPETAKKLFVPKNQFIP